MPRYYKPESFLRYLKYNTVRQFLEFIGVDNKLPPKLKKQSRAGYLKKLFDSFDEATNKQIDAIFREVHTMGNESGVTTLLNLFRKPHPDLAKEIQNKSNNYNQALYIYMKDPELFKRAATLSYYDEKKIKAQRTELKQVPVSELYDQKEALAKATKKPSFEILFIYYPNEGKLELACKGGNNSVL